MSKTLKANEDLMNTLHQLVAKSLIERVQDIECTPQELSAAIKFLKDNEVVADITQNKPLQQLAGTVTEIPELPFMEADDAQPETD